MNNLNAKNEMTSGFSFSTKAIYTYDKCCELFGFKRAMRGCFAWRKRLYATHATPEGYNVLMLAHHSLIETFNKKTKWFNIIQDTNTIKEVWFASSTDAGNDLTPRVTFLKMPGGKYLFFGIFVLEKAAMEEVESKYLFVRTYKRISSTYPMDEKPKTDALVSIPIVTDACIIDAFIIEKNKNTIISVDVTARPIQKILIGKKVGDMISFPNIDLTYRIDDIKKKA